MQHIKASLFRLRAYALRRDRLPPTPDVGALIVLFVYEGFGSTRLAALACYALAGRRWGLRPLRSLRPPWSSLHRLAMDMPPAPRAQIDARCRSQTQRQIPIYPASANIHFLNTARREGGWAGAQPPLFCCIQRSPAAAQAPMMAPAMSLAQDSLIPQPVRRPASHLCCSVGVFIGEVYMRARRGESRNCTG